MGATRLTRLTLAFVALALISGCRENKTTPAPSASAKPPASAPIALIERPVSGEVAFDLVAVTDGAALVWGEGKTVRVQALNGKGALMGEPVGVAPPDADNVATVFEVSAAAVGSRLALGWTLRAGSTASTWGALGDLATRSFAPPFALGATVLGESSQRGGVALAASDKGEFFVMRRGPDETCRSVAGKTCAGFGFSELLTTGPESRGLPMAVPAACSRPISGFVRVGERWHYALCSNEDGQSVTTAFMRQPQPFYVDVKRALAGCAPAGMTRIGDEALLVGACSDGRRGVAIAGVGSTPREIDLEKSRLECERGFPRLSGSLDLRLDRARDGFAPLLPLSIAPANARVAWTGTTLLVATWVKNSVALRRYECRGAELQRAE